MYWICSSVFILLTLSRWTSADCYSYGVDYVDGGGPYCINTTSTDFFSFVSDFQGCHPSDSQGDITPILIDPNGDEYFCSDVPTMPDDVDMTSTCNVPGNELEKSQMFSGNWMIVMEGLTFAWMRTFDIVAGPPVTVTSTPTATFTITNVPSTTITTTTTNVYSTTLAPSTITVPSSTSTRTITTTPAQVTVYWTSTSTRTRTTRVWSSTVSTTTVTTTCKTQPPKRDPTCTIRPTKATLAAASNTADPVPRQRFRGAPRRDRPRDIPKHALIEPRNGLLAKRGADVCTTTVLETTKVVSSYVTVTAPTSTEIDTEIATSTATVTPAPVTAYSGVVKTTTTITAPTPTRTRTARVYETTWTTSTIMATITSTVKTTPAGMVCATVPARLG